MVNIPENLLKICPDLPEWPESWQGEPDDVPLGKKILHELVPFLEWIVDRGYTKRTVRRHFDNIWALGGELIRNLQWQKKPVKINIAKIIADAVDEEGGPLLHNSLGGESEQRAFDATCRKLCKFINENK